MLLRVTEIPFIFGTTCITQRKTINELKFDGSVVKKKIMKKNGYDKGITKWWRFRVIYFHALSLHRLLDVLPGVPPPSHTHTHPQQKERDTHKERHRENESHTYKWVDTETEKEPQG